MHDDMKQELEEGHFTGGEEMEEVRRVDAKDMDNIDDAGAGVAKDLVEGETKEKPRRRTRMRKN